MSNSLVHSPQFFQDGYSADKRLKSLRLKVKSENSLDKERIHCREFVLLLLQKLNIEKSGSGTSNKH